ncbi:hypothetical protein MMC07_009240 [Pseudocyphellaria aurata]|nr:hypothetical protein [Pseudocyphellaria aurata]
MSLQSPWLALAAASGACAAFNGGFAKLTTTELTSSWASAIATTIGLSASNRIVEFFIRATCFLLNLAFNALMWALFTAALTRASSTTRVSIINTSSNFMLTALLGLIVFGERLPPLWWLGAGFLVAGNVVIGRRQEDAERVSETGTSNWRTVGRGEDGNEEYRDQGEGEISDGVEVGSKEVMGAEQRGEGRYRDQE